MAKVCVGQSHEEQDYRKMAMPDCSASWMAISLGFYPAILVMFILLIRETRNERSCGLIPVFVCHHYNGIEKNRSNVDREMKLVY